MSDNIRQFFLGEPESFGRKTRVTFYLLLAYVLGTNIPVPFVDSSVFAEAMNDTAVGGILASAMSIVGSSLSRLGVLSLGVMPYITSSIIFSILKVGFPKIKELYETERDKIAQYTRYLTILLAAGSAFGILRSAPNMLGVSIFPSNSALAFWVAWFSLVAGAVISMRIGEEITIRGVSNGTSLLIFTSILSGMPSLVLSAYLAHGLAGVVGLLSIIAGILAVVSFIEKGVYKVVVDYFKPGSRTYEGRSFLPIKVAIAGVLPVIFSSTFMSFPLIFGSLLNSWTRPSWLSWSALDGQWLIDMSNAMPFGSFWHVFIYAVLTIIMTFASVPMVFDAEEIAKSINQKGGVVLGARGAGSLRRFLVYISHRMAGLDVIYLLSISAATIFLFPLVGVNDGAFGATSIIILTTVAVTFRAALVADKSSKKSTLNGFLTREK